MARGLREPKDVNRRERLRIPTESGPSGSSRRSGSERPTLPDETSRAPWAIPVVLSLAAIAFGTYRAIKAPPSDAPPPADSSSAAPAPAAVPPAPRCVPVTPDPFVVGDAPRPP